MLAGPDYWLYLFGGWLLHHGVRRVHLLMCRAWCLSTPAEEASGVPSTVVRACALSCQAQSCASQAQLLLQLLDPRQVSAIPCQSLQKWCALESPLAECKQVLQAMNIPHNTSYIKDLLMSMVGTGVPQGGWTHPCRSKHGSGCTVCGSSGHNCAQR